MVSTPKNLGIYIGLNISKVYYANNSQSRRRNSYYIEYDLFPDESPKLVLTLQAHTITYQCFFHNAKTILACLVLLNVSTHNYIGALIQVCGAGHELSPHHAQALAQIVH